jgi:hypothetical protein
MGECLSAILPAPSGPIVELEAGNNVECCVTERTHSPFNLQREPDDSEASIMTNIPERFEDDVRPTVKD